MAEYNPSKIIKDGNTYNFTDTTKIPLAGSNQISGSLIPATDNAYDFGDSSHNFKTVYAKEIRHGLSSGSLVLSGGNETTNGANLVLYGTNRSDGFQGRFDLVAKGSSDYKLTGFSTGTLTWNGDIVDTIEEQGNGYIRYSNGIQICHGNVTNDNNLATGRARFTFPKAFNAQPNVTVTPNVSAPYAGTAHVESGTTWVLNNLALYRSPSEYISDPTPYSYIAIGTWK